MTPASRKHFKLVVPPGQASLTLTISGGTGDVDMYARFNDRPTVSSYSCRPFHAGNTETCTIRRRQLAATSSC